MKFELPPLPYAHNALEPVISQRTVHHHYEKHHAGYLKKVDAALEGDERQKSLEDIIRAAADGNQGLFNSAAQVWNHNFYWQSLSPDNPSLTDDRLKALVDQCFGSEDAFKQQFKDAAVGQFGSGWAWLVFDPATEKLEITSTSDAETPLTSNKTPLLTIDVWEHAYYLDHQQDRPGYVEGCLDKLLNWDFAAANLNR